MDSARIESLLTVPAAVTLLPETDSTSTQLRRLAEAGAPHGTVLIAERQTGGRGRTGKHFDSPAGGLYLSVLLRPEIEAEAVTGLSPAAALGVCAAVEQVCGLKLGIKWVNDLILNGRKAGGILTELGLSQTGRVSYVLIGVGLNTERRSFPPELRDVACSLADAAPVDREALAAALISELFRLPETLRSPDCLSRYRSNCVTLGKEIRVLRGNEVMNAYALDLAEDYSLIVRRSSDGGIERVSSGEVSVRGLSAYT